MKEGDVQNLYKVDFTDDVALATSPGGELFFGAVFDGIIPDMAYRAEGQTIIVGHIEGETDQEVRFDCAIAMTPQQMRQTHQATNYSPLDCCRGLLNDIRNLQPGLLKPIVVKKYDVKQRLALANT